MICQNKGFLRTAMLATALTAFAAAPLEARAQADRGGMPGDFDYYVLALSWSPTFCNGRSGDEDGGRGGYDNRYEYNGQYGDDRGYGGRRYHSRQDEQCSGTRPYAFVLHGLWPQYDRKGWPEACQTGNRAWVPGETIDRMMDIMPSRHLVIHEYKTHGVCSGLDPQQYFEAARKAYQSIRIPDQFQDLQQPLNESPEDVRKAFLAANPQLSADTITIDCSRRLLREVRICLTKDLTPRPCSRNERDRCTYDTVTLPPVRGGGTGPHGGPSDGRGDNQ
ncbi:MAG: ribonuclease T2 family protein [Rhodomicrobium sp.]